MRFLQAEISIRIRISVTLVKMEVYAAFDPAMSNDDRRLLSPSKRSRTFSNAWTTRKATRSAKTSVRDRVSISARNAARSLIKNPLGREMTGGQGRRVQQELKHSESAFWSAAACRRFPTGRRKCRLVRNAIKSGGKPPHSQGPIVPRRDRKVDLAERGGGLVRRNRD